MRHPSILAGVAIAALLAAAACDSAPAGARDGRGPLGAPDGPARSVGITATVTVVCPNKIQAQTSGYCWAYGVDTLGYYSGTSSGGTFSSGTPTTMAVASNGNWFASQAGTVTVYGTVDGVTGSTSVTIRPAADPSVSIAGPNNLAPNSACSWTASTTGGTTPITYSWSVTAGSPSGSASGATWSGQSASSFTLRVEATDADGRKSVATRGVNVFSGMPPC